MVVAVRHMLLFSICFAAAVAHAEEPIVDMPPPHWVYVSGVASRDHALAAISQPAQAAWFRDWLTGRRSWRPGHSVFSADLAPHGDEELYKYWRRTCLPTTNSMEPTMMALHQSWWPRHWWRSYPPTEVITVTLVNFGVMWGTSGVSHRIERLINEAHQLHEAGQTIPFPTRLSRRCRLLCSGFTAVETLPEPPALPVDSLRASRQNQSSVVPVIVRRLQRSAKPTVSSQGTIDGFADDSSLPRWVGSGGVAARDRTPGSNSERLRGEWFRRHLTGKSCSQDFGGPPLLSKSFAEDLLDGYAMVCFWPGTVRQMLFPNIAPPIELETRPAPPFQFHSSRNRLSSSGLYWSTTNPCLPQLSLAGIVERDSRWSERLNRGFVVPLPLHGDARVLLGGHTAPEHVVSLSTPSLSNLQEAFDSRRWIKSFALQTPLAFRTQLGMFPLAESLRIVTLRSFVLEAPPWNIDNLDLLDFKPPTVDFKYLALGFPPLALSLSPKLRLAQ